MLGEIVRHVEDATSSKNIETTPSDLVTHLVKMNVKGF